MGHDGGYFKVTWLGHLIMPSGIRNVCLNMCYCIKKNRAIILLEMNDKC